MRNKIVYSIIKRLFDIVASLCGTIVLIPVTIIVGLAIKIEDGGPIFFAQERLTKNGKPLVGIKRRFLATESAISGFFMKTHVHFELPRTYYTLCTPLVSAFTTFDINAHCI